MPEAMAREEWQDGGTMFMRSLLACLLLALPASVLRADAGLRGTLERVTVHRAWAEVVRRVDIPLAASEMGPNGAPLAARGLVAGAHQPRGATLRPTRGRVVSRGSRSDRPSARSPARSDCPADTWNVGR